MPQPLATRIYNAINDLDAMRDSFNHLNHVLFTVESINDRGRTVGVRISYTSVSLLDDARILRIIQQSIKPILDTHDLSYQRGEVVIQAIPWDPLARRFAPPSE